MSKNIVDGVLVEMSPSMISAFDGSTSFGCERRGWFKYVMGLPEPMTTSTTLGENLHSLCESRLLTGKTPSGEGEAFGLYLAGQAMIESVAARKILKVEQPIPSFYIEGVLVKGYNDVVTEDGIVDWKTSSDIRRYGKTASELATDTAMVLYGKSEHPNLKTVKLAHGQFQTKGRKSTDFVEVEVTQEHLDAHIEKVIIPKVERMKLVAGFTDAKQATPDFKKCFNCAFKTRCPSPESENVMSFFSKMKSATPAAAIIDGGDMAVKSDPYLDGILKKTESAKVTPPDAPKSDPAKAAVPVEGFQALPPAKKTMLIVDTPSALKEEMVKAMDAVKRDPRNNADDAFEAFSAMDDVAWGLLVKSLASGGVLQPEEQKGFARAFEARGHKPLQEVAADVIAAHEGKGNDSAVAAAKEAIEKRGRGRPPGRKNNPKPGSAESAQEAAKEVNDELRETLQKIEDSKATASQIRESIQSACKPSTERKFKSVTISKGATINVGNFNSVRFDVSVTSEEHTYEEILAEVSLRLDAEAAKYEAEMAKGSTVPAKGVVSK